MQVPLYSSDSLFTLAPTQIFGVLAIVVTLSALCVCANRLARRQPFPIRLTAAIVIFWTFE